MFFVNEWFSSISWKFYATWVVCLKAIERLFYSCRIRSIMNVGLSGGHQRKHSFCGFIWTRQTEREFDNYRCKILKTNVYSLTCFKYCNRFGCNGIEFNTLKSNDFPSEFLGKPSRGTGPRTTIRTSTAHAFRSRSVSIFGNRFCRKKGSNHRFPYSIPSSITPL